MWTYLLVLFGHVELWTPLLGVLLPLAVAFVTKRTTAPGVQGALFTLAAAILGVVSAGMAAADQHAAFSWGAAITAALTAWITGQVAHTALWTHGLAPWLQGVGPIKDRPQPVPELPSLDSALVRPTPSIGEVMAVRVGTSPGRHEYKANP